MSTLVAAVAAALTFLVLRPRAASPAGRLADVMASGPPLGARPDTPPGSASGRRGHAVPLGGALARVAVVLTLLAGIALAIGPVVPAVALGVVAAGVVLARRRRRRQRREAAARAAVEVVFALAAELRAGHPPGAALAAAARGAGPLEQPLAEAAGAVRAGAAGSGELLRVARLPGCQSLLAVSAAWEVTEQVGGAVADVLDRLGDALDADEQTRRALEAALAGPRATMALLAGLPLLGVALGESIGAHPLRLLIHRPLGWALLAGAGLLDMAGIAWTGWLGRAAIRP